jgi:hypothetical protein
VFLTSVMSDLKTRPTDASVAEFIGAIADERVRAECNALNELMREITGEEPRLWMNNTIGFGTYHYRYSSGQEGDWYLTGFAPRKGKLTIYVMTGFPQHEELMARLGRHTIGKSCLYLRSLDDVDLRVLGELIRRSYEQMRATYPEA